MAAQYVIRPTAGADPAWHVWDTIYCSNDFESATPSEVIAECQRLNGWSVDGLRETYGRQMNEANGNG